MEPAEAVGEALRERGQTLAVAESCTGGLLGAWLTRVPGASAYFLGGVICYSDRVKAGLAGVSRQTLREHGAVSAEVAGELARGARHLFGADYALSVTGIAGPGGGTAEKPVGLVYVGIAGPEGTRVERLKLPGDRKAIREEAAAAALRLLEEELDGAG